MKYIKNLEDKILTEGLADDAAEVSGLDSEAVDKAVNELDFAAYLELGNAVEVEDADRIREILNVSDVVPQEPIAADEIDLEEDDEHPEDYLPHDPTEACNNCGGEGIDNWGQTCITCGGKGRLTLSGEYIDDDDFEVAYGYDEILGEGDPFYDKPIPGKKLAEPAKSWGEILWKLSDRKLTKLYNQKMDDCGGAYNPGTSAVTPIKKEMVLRGLLNEADNPSAPAAAPAQPAATPPSAGSTIDAIAQPIDTAAPQDDEEEPQGHKEIEDLMIGDEVEVADIDGQPAAGRIRNLAGPGDTLVITGKGNEEHMIRKDSILSTPLIPVQEKQQSRLDKTHLGKKNKRAERVEKKKQKDVQEGWMEDAAEEDAKIAEFNEKEWAPLGFKRHSNWPGGTTFVANGDPRKLVRAKFKQEGWQKQEDNWWKHPALGVMSAMEYDRGRVTITSMFVPSYMREDLTSMREAYEKALEADLPDAVKGKADFLNIKIPVDVSNKNTRTYLPRTIRGILKNNHVRSIEGRTTIAKNPATDGVIVTVRGLRHSNIRSTKDSAVKKMEKDLFDQLNFAGYNVPHHPLYQSNGSIVIHVNNWSEEDTPQWDIDEDVGDRHQKKIAIDTIKNPTKGMLLGGPTPQEAEDTLRSKFGYDDKKIAKLKEGRDIKQKRQLKVGSTVTDSNGQSGEVRAFLDRSYKGTRVAKARYYGSGASGPEFFYVTVDQGNRMLEAQINEGLSFFVEPLAGGKFEVRSDNGDHHDVYDSGEEAVRVAGELNAQYGEVDEATDEQPNKDVCGDCEGEGCEWCDPNYDDLDDFGGFRGTFDEDVQRIKELAGLNEVKSGKFNSKMVGKRVKVIGQDSFGGEHHGEEGVVTRASREHTFSQMVPFIIEYGVDLDNGERITIRREHVRKLKIQETASGGGTGAGAIASSPTAVGGMQSRNRSIYGQTKLRKKPAPKKRPTREEKGDGIGRNKKD